MHTKTPNIPDEYIITFAEQFSAQLLKPTTTGVPFVIYFIGMIGSGKSTTAKFFSAEYNLVRVSTDEIRDFLQDHYYSRERSFDVAEIVTEKLLQKGFGVCLDADLVDQYFQDHVIALCKRAGVQAILLHIQTPEAVILKRLQADNVDRIYKGEMAINDYMGRKHKFENLNIQPVAVIDGSGNFEEQMKRTVQAIDAKLEAEN